MRKQDWIIIVAGSISLSCVILSKVFDLAILYIIGVAPLIIYNVIFFFKRKPSQPFVPDGGLIAAEERGKARRQAIKANGELRKWKREHMEALRLFDNKGRPCAFKPEVTCRKVGKQSCYDVQCPVLFGNKEQETEELVSTMECVE